jgi:hypothetical protein
MAFLRSKQVTDLVGLAESLNERPRIIECVCSDAAAQERLERDLAQGRHVAKNRNYALYLAVKERAEPIAVPHLVVDTTTATLDECLERCVRYLKSQGACPA